MFTIREVMTKFKDGSLDPVQLCEMCLRRIKKSKDLNVFVTVTEKLAQKQAEKSWQRIKAGTPLGPLDGVPIAVKDNLCIKGLPTTCASKMLLNYVPPYTASAVKRLHQQGSILVGKTNMDEFAMGTGSTDSVFGPVKNPWRSGLKYRVQNRNTNESLAGVKVTDGLKDDFYICGGSSGGSAAAVAVGASVVALGSDTGGSTRAPAAMCGVVGLKPTYGTVSRHGLIPLVNSMDIPGILGGTVDDVATVFNAVSGHDAKDSTTVAGFKTSVELPEEPSVTQTNVGVPREFFCFGMASEVVTKWQSVADLLEDGGARVRSVSLPFTQHSLACYSVLNCCEVASNMSRYDGIEFGLRSDCSESTEAMFAAGRHEGFNEVVRGRILAGNYFLLRQNYSRYFVKALQVRRLIVNDYIKAFNSGIDVLLTPVTLSDAPKYSEFSQKDNQEQVSIQDFCTQPVNMAGLPAVSVPVGFSSSGLPLGIQIIGNHFSEEKILSVAKWIECQLNSWKMDISE